MTSLYVLHGSTSRARANRYPAVSRVELRPDRIRREASAVLNPLLAPRSVIEVEQ